LALLLTGNRELWSIVAISFSVSLRAILIAAPMALGVAFLLAHLRFPGRRLLISAFNTLLALPAVMVGLTVYMLLSRNGPPGRPEAIVHPDRHDRRPDHPLPATAGRHEPRRAAGCGPARLGDHRHPRRQALVEAMLTLMYEVRFGLIAAVVAAFGRIIAKVGSSMMVGGNILNYTRNIPTAIALETSKGEFAQGIALGLVLLLLALVLNFSLSFLQGKGTIRP